MLKGYVAPLFHIGTYVTWLVVLRQEKFELRKIQFEDSMARLNPDPVLAHSSGAKALIMMIKLDKSFVRIPPCLAIIKGGHLIMQAQH